VPENTSPKIIELVNQLTAGKVKEEILQAVVGFLNSGGYRYSLENLPITKTPIEDFLFKYKYGNCEYFASACAVMLRIAGIPSRLVGGYKGGYYNDVGKYYLVPQKNAHIWIEAYLKNKGWIRVDPTPGGIEAFSSPTKADIIFRLGILFDTINYYWLAFVINYNFEKQMNMIHALKTSFHKPKIRFIINNKASIVYGVFVVCLSGVVVSILVFLLMRFLKKDYIEKRLLSTFLKKMKKKGFIKEHSQGLEEFVYSIKPGELNNDVFMFVSEFEKLYYQDKPFARDDVKRLKSILKKV